MMGKKKIVEGQKCDSCGRIVTLLIPVRVLQEYSWGSEMVTKYYCLHCFEMLFDSQDDEYMKNRKVYKGAS